MFKFYKRRFLFLLAIVVVILLVVILFPILLLITASLSLFTLFTVFQRKREKLKGTVEILPNRKHKKNKQYKHEEIEITVEKIPKSERTQDFESKTSSKNS